MKTLILVTFACFASICGAQTNKTQDEKIAIKYIQWFCKHVTDHSSVECDRTGKYDQRWRTVTLRYIRNNPYWQNALQKLDWKGDRNNPEFMTEDSVEVGPNLINQLILTRAILQTSCESLNHKHKYCDETGKYDQEWQKKILDN